MAGGRPSKFNEQLKTIVLRLSEKGLTDPAICEVIGIDQKTLLNWKKANPEFFLALKNAKNIVDDEVEDTLLNRALGRISIKKEKAFVINGIVEKVKLIEQVPPDVTACIFWLKNRQPDKWREKVDHNIEKELKVIIEKEDQKL
jgi:hypothetical protein